MFRLVFSCHPWAHRFSTVWVSQAAAKQRAGRAGRTRPGLTEIRSQAVKATASLHHGVCWAGWPKGPKGKALALNLESPIDLQVFAGDYAGKTLWRKSCPSTRSLNSNGWRPKPACCFHTGKCKLVGSLVCIGAVLSQELSTAAHVL